MSSLRFSDFHELMPGFGAEDHALDVENESMLRFTGDGVPAAGSTVVLACSNDTR